MSSVGGGAEGPEDGHTFAISYRSRGSYTVKGDPEHTDEPDFSGPTHRVEVRAWNLRDALRIAAELPFDVLMGEEVDEQDERIEHEGEGLVGGQREWQVGEAAFLARRNRGDTYWVIVGPNGETGGWGAYFLQGPAEDTAERLTRAYQLGHAAGLVKGLTGGQERAAEQAGDEPACARCGRTVHDFHGDRVWRDAEGWITCDQLPVRVNSPFHTVEWVRPEPDVSGR